MLEGASQNQDRWGAVTRGVRITGALGGTLLVWLYTFWAPTDDIRARIPFLLLAGGLWTAAILAVTMGAVGLAGLAAIGAVNRASLRGVPVGAILVLFFLYSGLVGKALPEVQVEWVRWVLILGAIGAASITVVLERRGLRSLRQRSQSTESTDH